MSSAKVFFNEQESSSNIVQVENIFQSFPITARQVPIKDLIGQLIVINNQVSSIINQFFTSNSTNTSEKHSVQLLNQIYSLCSEKYKWIILEDIYLRQAETESCPDEKMTSDLNISMLDDVTSALQLKAVLFEALLGPSLKDFWLQCLHYGNMYPEWVLKFAYSIVIELSLHIRNIHKDSIVLKKCCTVLRNMTKLFHAASKNSKLTLDQAQSFISYIYKAYLHLMSFEGDTNEERMEDVDGMVDKTVLKELSINLCKILKDSLQVLLTSIPQLSIIERELSPVYCMNSVLNLLDNVIGIGTFIWGSISSILERQRESLLQYWSAGNATYFMKGYLEKTLKFIEDKAHEFRKLAERSKFEPQKDEIIESYVLHFKELLKCLTCFCQCANFSSFTRVHPQTLSQVFVALGKVFYVIMESIIYSTSCTELCEMLRQMYTRLDTELRVCISSHLKNLYQIDSNQCLTLLGSIFSIDGTSSSSFSNMIGKLLISSMILPIMLPEIDPHDALTHQRLITEMLESTLQLTSAIHPSWFAIVVPLIQDITFEPTLLDIITSDILIFIAKSVERGSEHEVESLLKVLWKNIVCDFSVISSIICSNAILYCTAQLIDYESAITTHVLDTISHLMIVTGHNIFSVLPLNQDAPEISNAYFVSQRNLSDRLNQLCESLCPILKEHHISYLRRKLVLPSADLLCFDIIHCSQLIAQMPQGFFRKIVLEQDSKENFSVVHSLWSSLVDYSPKLIDTVIKKRQWSELPLLQSFLFSIGNILGTTNNHFWKSQHCDILELYIEKETKIQIRNQKQGEGRLNPLHCLQHFVSAIVEFLCHKTQNQSRLPLNFHLERCKDAALQVFAHLLNIQQHVTYLKQCIIRTDQVLEIIRSLKLNFEENPFMRPMISSFIRRLGDCRLSGLPQSEIIFSEIASLMRMMVSPPRIDSNSVVDIAIVSILSQNLHHFIRDFVYFSKFSGMPDQILKVAMPTNPSDRQKVIATIKNGSFITQNSIDNLSQYSFLQSDAVSIKKALIQQTVDENLKLKMSSEEMKRLQRLYAMDKEVFGELYTETENALSNSVLLMKRLVKDTPTVLNIQRLEVMSCTLLQLLGELRKKRSH